MLPRTKAVAPAAWSIVNELSNPLVGSVSALALIALSSNAEHLSQRHVCVKAAVSGNDEGTEHPCTAVLVTGTLLGVHVGPLRIRVSRLERTALLGADGTEAVVEISLAVLLDAAQPVDTAAAVVCRRRVAAAAGELLRRLYRQRVGGVYAAPAVAEQQRSELFNLICVRRGPAEQARDVLVQVRVVLVACARVP